MSKLITLHEFIMDRQSDFPFATGELSRLLNDISIASKIVNKDVVLFKAFNKEKSYSESAIITRKTGELIHEITKNINSENSEKYITIYYCKNKTKNA